MPADLRAVAEASGVSISTASRALSGSTRISAATRTRVLRAADTLGYRPNVAARGLRTRRSRLIGLVIPTFHSRPFLQAADLIQGQLAEHGYQVVLSMTGGDDAREVSIMETLAGRQVDGIIAWGMHERSADLLSQLRLPVVHLDQQSGRMRGDSIRAANLETTREVIRYFTARGHRRIALINGPDQAVEDGYRLALSAAGIEYDPSLVHLGGDWKPEVGHVGVNAVTGGKQPPTAIYFACQEVWSAGLPRLADLGIEVGKDISVICRDDDPMLQWWNPPITVVDMDIARMAELATTLLLERIDSDSSEFTDIVVNTRMTERQSVIRV